MDGLKSCILISSQRDNTVIDGRSLLAVALVRHRSISRSVLFIHMRLINHHSDRMAPSLSALICGV